MEVMKLAEKYLCEITGMSRMTFQPAAGAHGEFTGLLLMKAYHVSRGDTKRTKIIVPDSAHGTNPASAPWQAIPWSAFHQARMGAWTLKN